MQALICRFFTLSVICTVLLRLLTAILYAGNHAVLPDQLESAKVTAEGLKQLASTYCEEAKLKITDSVPKAIIFKFVQEMQVFPCLYQSYSDLNSSQPVPSPHAHSGPCVSPPACATCRISCWTR